MPQFEEVVIDSDEDAESAEWPQLRKAYDEWMHCPDYAATAHEILLVTEKVPDVPHQNRWIVDAVRNIYHEITTDEFLEEDLIGLSLTAWSDTEHHQVVVMGMRSKAQLNVSALLKAFEGIKRDREAFLTKARLVVKVKSVRRYTRQRVSDVGQFHQRCLNKKSILTAGATRSPVENLSRALVLSKAYNQREGSVKLKEIYRRLRSANEVHLKVEADALRKMARGRAEDSFGLAVRRFDRYYTKTFTITVFLGLDGRQVLYESWAPPVAGRPRMDVVTDGHEFHVVTSVSAAFSSGQQYQYCRLCRVHYRHETEHQCLESCRHCRKVGVCVPHYGMSCGTCRRDFVSDSCFKRHLDENRTGKSTCDLLKMCKYCLEWYSVEGRRRRHICGDRFCKTCKEMRPAKHTCQASSLVRAIMDARGNGRPVSAGGSGDNSGSAKRRRLDNTSVRGASQGRTAAVSQSGGASTSRERDDGRDGFTSETAVVSANSPSGPSRRSPTVSAAGRSRDSSLTRGRGVGSRLNTQTQVPVDNPSGPSTRSPTISTAARPRDGFLTTERGVSSRLNTQTRSWPRPEVAQMSASSPSGPSKRSPTVSTAASPRESSRTSVGGVASRLNTSADAPLRQAPAAAWNQPSGRDAVQDGPQRGRATEAAHPPTTEGGTIPPHPVRAFHYPEEGRVVIYLN